VTPNANPGVSHRDFIERTLAAAGEWSRYADPKLLGVLILLGIGSKDLVGHADRFVHPRGAAGVVAAVLFALAGTAACWTVLFLTHGLFPRLNMRGLLHGEKVAEDGRGPLPKSLFYFGEIARHGSQQAYRVAVTAKTEQQLLDDMVGQVYEIATIASEKHRAARRAYVAVIGFLALWVASRIALSISS
jgi:hypothetical protein